MPKLGKVILKKPPFNLSLITHKNTQMKKLPEVKKIYCEKKTGEITIMLLPKPIAFPVYYAFKFALNQNKIYSKIKAIY